MDESSDFEKLQKALSTLTGHFASFEEILHAFGLANMPAAQRYGIMFGFLVFTLTITAVVTLLVLGGSFARIAQQAKTGDVVVSDPVASRSERPLLFERLLEARERMMRENYPEPERTSGRTNLMKMLLNLPIKIRDTSELANDDAAKTKNDGSIPPGYQDDYVEAYRKCQEKPGGSSLSGRPEARFEAYARAYAGCGRIVTREYRRSYARLYETFSCQTHGSDDLFQTLYKERPEDLIGRRVRLEALETERHADELHNITCGASFQESKSFDPNEVWGFLSYGPFRTCEELKRSPIFRRKVNEAGFAVIDNITNRLIGVVMLTNDDPENLTISLEPPIIKPSTEGNAEIIEAFFLLIEKLFAIGYRRVQLAIDSQDAVNKKMAARLGFTKESEIPKHMVVKDANRDSTIYGMLNSDWSKGCRKFLFKKLHGARIQKIDEAFNKKESELDEQKSRLAEQKALSETEISKP